MLNQEVRRYRLDSANRSSSSVSTASSVEIYTVMGLFNSGKNEKIEKVNKYERHYNVPSNSSHRRRSLKHSSKEREREREKDKHESKHGHSNQRALSQPPFMRYPPPQAQFYPTPNMFNPNIYSQFRYPMATAAAAASGTPFDLSKYPNAIAQYPSTPYQMATPINYSSPSPLWNNQPLSILPQNNYQFMPPMQF